MDALLNHNGHDRIPHGSSCNPCFHGNNVHIVLLSSPGDHHNVLFPPDNIHSDSQQVQEPGIRSEPE